MIMCAVEKKTIMNKYCEKDDYISTNWQRFKDFTFRQHQKLSVCVCVLRLVVEACLASCKRVIIIIIIIINIFHVA